VIIAVTLATLAGRAISAQDKYTVQVPGGLAFSEFRGYECWPVIAISENNGKIAAIVGNPVMIDAYKEGVPGNGKPFPDGAKMAKIHWNPKKLKTPFLSRGRYAKAAKRAHMLSHGCRVHFRNCHIGRSIRMIVTGTDGGEGLNHHNHCTSDHFSPI
jgi:hypothetical protein